MPVMPQPPPPPARRPAREHGVPPWEAGLPHQDRSLPPWELDARWEGEKPAAAGPPWEIGDPTWEDGDPTWEAGGPPWEPSQPPGPPWEPSQPPGSQEPTDAGQPPDPPGPPWEPSQPPPSPPGPPWEPSQPPPEARQRVPAGGPKTISAPPADMGAFTRTSGDPPSTGSLPAVTGGLVRRQGTFTGRITRDGSSGFPVERSRYQIYASLACPWSQRVLIACRLLGLDRVVGLTLTDPVTDERGWRISDGGEPDPVTGATLLADLYRATDAGYRGPFTLPLVWDMRTRRVVSNDVAQITLMLETEFRSFHRPGSPDLYPAARRREIDSLGTLIFHTVNTGVYKAGLATTQEGYEQAVEAVFTTLDALDERLARRRFLLGDQLTDADIRLFPTLVRFDAVYYQLFGCNLRHLADYRHLWAYARDLYTLPGFGETTDLGQIKRHYFQSAEWAEHNRSGIVPIGPRISWNEPHGRARMPS